MYEDNKLAKAKYFVMNEFCIGEKMSKTMESYQMGLVLSENCILLECGDSEII